MTVSGIPAVGERLGDYEVLGELGRGGMAVVLEVRKVSSDTVRAIKLMLPGSRAAEVAGRFRREFRALSRLHHPNVLRVFEWGMYGEQPYFVMERLKGRVLRDEVEAWRELAPAERYRRAEHVLTQLARALEAIHDRGWVHRDVTPTNVMIAPDGTARLMDFGVVKEPGADLTVAGEVVGTVAYIAPEQVTGGPVDARADLYSLGAVLYLMLTGRRPFDARTLAGYLDKHLHRPVRPPHELAPMVPQKLDDICMRLLAKDPSERFASATHLLHVLESDTVAQNAGEPPLVGRAAEVARTREAVALLVADPETDGIEPAGGVLVIEGGPGTGRSRMAAEAAHQARRRGIPVSVARNLATERRAFEGFRSVWEDLVRAVPDLPAEAIAAIYGSAHAGDGGQPSDAPRQVDRWAVLSEFRDLLVRAAPRVIVLDDLDRATVATVELVEYLVRNLLAMADHKVLFVVTRRLDGDEDRLRGLVEGEATGVTPQVVRLEPLSTAAVEELLLWRVADGPGVRLLARRMHDEGEGNPLFLREMLRGLEEEGVVEVGRGGRRGRLTIDATTLERMVLPVPTSIRDALRERLAPLSADARAVACILAIARRELDLDLLIDAAGGAEGGHGSTEEPIGLEEERVLDAVDELVEAGLVRERRVGAEERLELAQNRLVDVVLAELSAAERQRIHRRLGLALERRHRRSTAAVVETLAWHFEQGGLAGKALPYLVRAGEALLARTFVDEAIEVLDRAIAIAPAAREFMVLEEADRLLVSLHLHRARAFFHLGRWDAGREEAREARRLADELGDNGLLARAETELGCHARRVRDLRAAEKHLERALEGAREAGDRRLEIVPLYESGAVCWARGDLDGARDFFIRALAASETFQDERSLALGYNGLGVLAICKGQSADARRYFEQAIEVSERHHIEERLTVARTNLVELHHFTGNLRRGLELADATVSHAREIRHRFGLALGLRYRGLILTDLGRLVEARENAEEALRIQCELGNREEELATLVVLERVELARGDLAAAERLLDRIDALLSEYDTEGFAPVVRAWRAQILAATGRADQARAVLRAAVSRRQWPHQEVRFRLNMARVHEMLGERERAAELAEEALRIADTCGYRYYAMRARQIAARVAADEAVVARHHRVAEALARSLAANLHRADAERFWAMQARGTQLRRLTESERSGSARS